MWQTYYTPTSIDEVLRLLSEHGSAARIIAGGTDLLIELRRQERQTRVLIDITRIGRLDQIGLDEDELIHIGPTVTHNLAAASDLLVERGFPLAMACWKVGTPQVRNRGTIVGNLVTASPANQAITALCALDARLTLRSIRGERTLSCADFYQGVRQTKLAPDEMVTDVTFPALASNQDGAFLKLGLRQANTIAVVNTAATLTFDSDKETITQARITLGSVAPTIIRAPEAERALIGKMLSEENIATAANLAAQATTPIDDIRAGADYRRDMARVLVRRALGEMGNSAEREKVPSDGPMLWGHTSGHFPRLAGRTVRHSAGGGESIECTVNGENEIIQGAGGKTLLAMLRDDLGLTGVKEGCNEGECGACTVWLDGIAVLACLTPAPRAHGAKITTIEGMSEEGELHPLQQAFIDEGAVQCGYCTPGFIMSGVSLLDEVPTPTREQITTSLTGNLCRCTGYHKIIQAVDKAAQVANDE